MAKREALVEYRPVGTPPWAIDLITVANAARWMPDAVEPWGLAILPLSVTLAETEGH